MASPEPTPHDVRNAYTGAPEEEDHAPSRDRTLCHVDRDRRGCRRTAQEAHTGSRFRRQCPRDRAAHRSRLAAERRAVHLLDEPRRRAAAVARERCYRCTRAARRLGGGDEGARRRAAGVCETVDERPQQLGLRRYQTGAVARRLGAGRWIRRRPLSLRFHDREGAISHRRRRAGEIPRFQSRRLRARICQERRYLPPRPRERGRAP